eukprot:m.180981 g.180981  ORF g.180981 m.180981 type:complete len:109 (+) comp18440_c0_seq2:250-576(+)
MDMFKKTATNSAKGTVKNAVGGTVATSVITKLAATAGDDTTKLGSFLKKGKTVAEKAGGQMIEKSVAQAMGGGFAAEMVGKVVASEAKKDPKKAMNIAAGLANSAPRK